MPCLLGLFSIVTLLAAQLGRRACLAVQADRWYRKRARPSLCARRSSAPHLAGNGFTPIPALA
jgi:hypothetical protein